MPASSASVSMDSSSSARVESRRTPSSSSCSRRVSGESRTRLAGVRHVAHLTELASTTLLTIVQYRLGWTHDLHPDSSLEHLPERVRVLVVGAGFAGLGAAIKLDEHGLGDFLVVDKGATVGGTWRDNTYPGAACDVPSQLYSFSFAPNPEWSRSFSPQPEIQAYLERTAARGRRARPVPLRRDGRGHRLRRGRPALDGHHRRRHRGRRRRHHRLRRPLGAQAARDRGHRLLRGRDLPLRALEPRLRPDRQARRRHRHRRLGDPDRPRGGQAGRPPRRLPAHRPVGDAAQRPGLHAGSRGSASATCRSCRRPTARASTGAASASSPASPSTPSWPPRPRRWRCRTSSAASPTPSCARR